MTNKITPRPDGRPISQMFHDEIHGLIKKFEETGLSNAECYGVLGFVQGEILLDLTKKEPNREELF